MRELSGVDNYCYVIKPPLLNLSERAQRCGCKCADGPPAVIISSRSFSPASNQICTRLLAFMNKLSKLGFGRVERDQIISRAH